MWRRFVYSLVLLAFSVFFMRAEQVKEIEYGNVGDLRGVNKIYIYTGMELEVQQNIANHIIDKLGDRVKIVNSAREAEVILAYGAKVFTSLVTVLNQQYSTTSTTGSLSYNQIGNFGTGSISANSTTTGSGSVTPIYQTTIKGNGLIFQPKNNGRTLRLIKEFDDSRTLWWLERRPSTNFAREFVHRWKEANEGFDFSTKVDAPVTQNEESAADNPAQPTAEPSQAAPVGPGATASFLSISSVPKGASIFVNENFVGMTPSKLRLPEGKYRVRLYLNGFAEWTQEIQIFVGSEINLDLELKKR